MAHLNVMVKIGNAIQNNATDRHYNATESNTWWYWVVLVVVVLGAIIPSFAHQAPQLSADDLENIEMERHQGPAAPIVMYCCRTKRIQHSDKQITDEKGMMNRDTDCDTMIQ